MNLEVLEEAVKKWGESSQLGMAQEECAELVVAINKFFRFKGVPGCGDGSGAKAYLDLCSEVADVEIMMAQMRIILGESAIKKAKRAKLARLKRRLKESK